MSFTDQERDLIITALTNQLWNSKDSATYGQYSELITKLKENK